MPQLNGDGSVLLTDDVIAKEALRLLKNNLVLAPLVHRNLEATFGKVGDTISVKKPFRTKTASGRTLVKQPLVDQTVPFNIDRQEHFGLEVTVRDRTLSLEQFSERYLKSGMVQLANVVDTSIATELATGTFFAYGTPGTTIVAKSFLYADAIQTEIAVPEDGMRRAVLNTMDNAEIASDIMEKYQPELVKGAIRKGYNGDLGGYSVYKTQNVPVHSVGAHGGTPLADSATAQTGNSIVTNGWTNDAEILNKGDIITFAGVYEINPQSYQSTGRLQKFVVTADVTASAAGAATIGISPSINPGGLTTVDAEGASISTAAYQNVSAAIVDNAAITVLGTASTTYRQNLLFHRDACALAVVDLELPQSAVVKSRVRDPESGLSLSMTGAYDVSAQSEITRIDVVWGVHMIYPELALRLFSDDV